MTVEYERVVGHGERALRLSQADLAARLSELAATTGALLRSVAEQGRLDPRLAPLRARAALFADEIHRLSMSDVSTNSYRRLVPYRLWLDAVEELRDLGDLPDALPKALSTLGQEGVDMKLVEALAERVERLAESFQAAGSRTLQQVLVPPTPR